jgi:hypothetical protein
VLQPLPSASTSPDTLASPSKDIAKNARFVMISWIAFVALCLLAKAGRLLGPLFPLGSVAVGLFLYFRTPNLYVGYAWWMCFVGSLVRRIIDYQSGFINPGRWSLTSTLVTSICLITLFRFLPKAHRHGGLPFIFSALTVIYAFLIGFVSGKVNSQYIVGLFEWLGPVAFGFHLFWNWQHYPTFRRTTQTNFVWGVLVMGVYGVLQYCTAPQWDQFYLNNLSVTSFGRPSPFEIRVFSTLSSPQLFATVMMAGLLMLFSSQGFLRFAASGVGYLSFLLSMARSGWLGFGAGTVLFFPFLKPRFQMQFVMTVLVIAFLVIPLVNIEPFAGVINDRLQSLTNPQGDVSFQDRSAGYSEALNLAFMEIIGKGLGASGPPTALGGSDSGILPLLFSFGWLGTIFYVGGILLILMQLMQSKDRGQDVFMSTTRAIALGTLFQVGFNNIFFDAFALILWGFLGVGLAGQKYYVHQINQASFKALPYFPRERVVEK